VATKVAVIACCAAVVGGGAVEVHQATAPPKPQAPLHPAVAPHLGSAPAPRPAAIRDATLQHPALKHANRIVEKAAPVPAVVAPDVEPASDSTVVEQSNGGMLAPDEADDTTTTDTPAGSGTPTTTGSSTDSTPTTTKPQTSTTGTSTGSGTASGAASGPDGGLTGSTPPSAQGATAPGAEKTPS
jgi:hypothetical protein